MSSSAPPVAVSPPPIGEALNAGWTTFQANMAPIAIGCACAMLPGLVPVLGQGVAFAGMMQVSRKALRGEVPQPTDGLVGLSDQLIDHVVMGLLQIAGILACCIGLYVTQAIFYPGTLLILERGISWDEAKDACLQRMKPNALQWTLFVFLVGLVGASGMILCVVGVFFTAPVAMIALAYAYEKTFGASPAPA
jgi:hypothetical protein